VADQPDGKSVTLQLGADDVFIWVGANAESRLDPITLDLVVAVHEALRAELSPEQRVEAITRILVEPMDPGGVDDICIRVLGKDFTEHEPS